MADLLSLGGNYIALQHEVPAIMVPDGTDATLPMGTEVTLIHELGGDFTVKTRRGVMFRIDGRHAGALGREVAKEAAPAATELTDELVLERLRSCFDPEIPVNIVDLGLVYELVLQPGEGGVLVHVTMTLTAPGCGMGQVLANDVQRKVETLPGVRAAKVNLVFDPPWNPSMMSEAARLQTGLF